MRPAPASLASLPDAVPPDAPGHAVADARTEAPVRASLGAPSRLAARFGSFGPAFAAWTLVALFTSAQAYVSLRATGRASAYWPLLRGSLINCWLWAAYTPFIVAAARRVPLGRPFLGRALAVHAAGVVAVTLLDAVFDLTARPLLEPERLSRPFVAAFLGYVFINTVCWFLVAFAVSAADHARASRARQEEARALSEQLASAQLDALRAQLRPHFLFNTLNTIAEQLHTDPRGADRMITRLATLLRATFEQPDAHEVPLARELETLRAYLDIMLVRFGDRLVVEVSPGPGTLGARVPPLLLQPIVENALRHGVEPAERGGRVEVRAWRDGAWLVLEVLDDGVGVAAGAAGGTGVGLRNTRARLQRLYGERQRLTLAPRRGGGTTVTVAIPFSDAPARAEAPCAS